MKLKLSTAAKRAGGLILVGLLILGVTIWKTYPKQSTKKLGKDLSKAAYMHCPKCENETRFNEELMDRECVCGYDKGMVATEESIKKEKKDGRSRYGTMLAFVMPEVVVLLAGLWLVLRPRAADVTEAYRFMRCPYCSQKLRYRKQQVGQVGACSRCKRAFRFPEGTPEERQLDGVGAYEEELEEVEE